MFCLAEESPTRIGVFTWTVTSRINIGNMASGWWFDIELLHNIGIKHAFSCISVRQVTEEVLKSNAKGRGFQHFSRDLTIVNALEMCV